MNEKRFQQIARLATKTDIKPKQDKIIKLQTHHLSYFLNKNVFSNV